MPNYRRSLAAGGLYFFTVNLADRGSDALTTHIEDLRAAVRMVRLARPFVIEAMVVLPDHLHAVWSLPERDCDFPTRWKEIKTIFTKRTGLSGGRSRSKRIKGERGLWQRRYWEHRIRDEADYRAHVAYCWGNPVKHGLVEDASEWRYSSIHRDMRLGRVPPEWGAPVEGEFGERQGA
ncbi:MAG: transposase [Roseovarius sp.]|uniref:REP-associated tyrosine transposase n=1 Tax=Roseovarius sp. TaxID=1486281 RepID=UPI0032ED139B